MRAVPGYEIGELLHEGRNSRVYRARRGDGLPVILKLLSTQAPSAEQIAWFRREHEMLRELRLPGVVATHGFEYHDHRWFIVLEDFGGRIREIGARLRAGGWGREAGEGS